MRAIHVNWTKPFFFRDKLRGHGFMITRQIPYQTYDIPDYQIFYTILSAYYWKRLNGPIKLYTDSIGLAFYKTYNLDILYDEIDIDFLDNYSKTKVEPATFWTSGKVKCMANQSSPFVFLDQDMIIKSKIPESLYTNDITIAHWEIPRGYYYFTHEDWLENVKHVEYPEGHDQNALMPNTSFLIFNNVDILKHYNEWHKKLVNTNGASVPEWFWLFSDQGILGYIIRKYNYTVNMMYNKVFLSENTMGLEKERSRGVSEQWYRYNTDKKDSDVKIEWEHVWLRKVFYGLDEKILKDDTQRFFNEIADLQIADKFLDKIRFKKYWDEYENKNN